MNAVQTTILTIVACAIWQALRMKRKRDVKESQLQNELNISVETVNPSTHEDNMLKENTVVHKLQANKSLNPVSSAVHQDDRAEKINNEEIQGFLFHGQKVRAIQYVRELTGGALIDAKRYVEEYERKLMEEYPERFNLPKPSEQQYEQERIKSKEDVIKAIAEVTCDFEVTDFKTIPMGWAADVALNDRKYGLYCRRGDISCNEYLSSGENEIRLDTYLDNLTQKQAIIRYIRKILGFMNVEDLREELRKNNINENICRIFPKGFTHGALCIDKSKEGEWVVFNHDRDNDLDQTFDNEHEACRYFLREALLEPTYYKDFVPIKLREKEDEIERLIKQYGFLGRH